MSDSATLTLDGNPVAISAGQTIMEAAQAAGHYIPHLCYHPALSPAGNCRLCTVRVDGRYAAACITPARPGQVVENRTEALDHLRRALVQQLFVEGNHCCPSCEVSGNCQLQAMAYEVGMLSAHFRHQFPRRVLDASHPDFVLDRDRCILCGLCVRASRELDNKDVFSLSGRGSATTLVVNSASGRLRDSALRLDDRAAHICPVGAILIRGAGFRRPIGQRLYDEQPLRIVGNRRPEEPAGPGETRHE